MRMSIGYLEPLVRDGVLIRGAFITNIFFWGGVNMGF